MASQGYDRVGSGRLFTGDLKVLKVDEAALVGFESGRVGSGRVLQTARVQTQNAHGFVESVSAKSQGCGFCQT